jgi:hypothetical protein
VDRQIPASVFFNKQARPFSVLNYQTMDAGNIPEIDYAFTFALTRRFQRAKIEFSVAAGCVAQQVPQAQP